MSTFDDLVGIVGIDDAIEQTAQNYDYLTQALFGMSGVGDILRNIWRDMKVQMWQHLMATTGAEHELDYYENPEARP